MNAKELMIGDWVQFANGNKIKCRINCISPHQRFVAHVDNATWLVNFDEIEPIPLTEEILKANGINRELPYPCDHVKICHNASEWFITFCECYGFDIKYLHELQHVLRLCGLNDLANNFKI